MCWVREAAQLQGGLQGVLGSVMLLSAFPEEKDPPPQCQET